MLRHVTVTICMIAIVARCGTSPLLDGTPQQSSLGMAASFTIQANTQQFTGLALDMQL